jgi:hypothetical protein
MDMKSLISRLTSLENQTLTEGARPDFLNKNKDGNKKEPMKKAVADKKKSASTKAKKESRGSIAEALMKDMGYDLYEYEGDSKFSRWRADIKRKVSEDGQGNLDIKKFSGPDPMGGGNHAYVDPKTGTIMYSGNAGGGETPSPMGSAQQWNDPKNATASVGRDLKDFLKQAGLQVTADAKGNAMVDPTAFNNLGKGAGPSAAGGAAANGGLSNAEVNMDQQAANRQAATAAATPPPTIRLNRDGTDPVTPPGPTPGPGTTPGPGPAPTPTPAPGDDGGVDPYVTNGTTTIAPPAAPTTAPMSSTGPQAQQDAQNRSEPVTARSQDQINIIKNMQRELGVNPDGKIGPATRDAMSRKPQIAAKYADGLGGARQYAAKPATPAKPPAPVPGKPDPEGAQKTKPEIPPASSGNAQFDKAVATLKAQIAAGGPGAAGAATALDIMMKQQAASKAKTTPTAESREDDRILNMIRSIKI